MGIESSQTPKQETLTKALRRMQMPKLASFTTISLDGFFCDSDGDFRWAHNPIQDKAWDNFVAGNAQGGGILLFGRVTYDLMKSYWPTPMAAQSNPVVAERMNSMQKIVFSRTLDQPSFSKTGWSNTQLVKGNLVEEVCRLKQDCQRGIVILGSGSIVSQLAQAGLIDEFQIVIAPIVLGKGLGLFSGLKQHLNLKLTESRSFSNGNVFLRYEPR
jgi:dihydrofolate reductase